MKKSNIKFLYFIILLNTLQLHSQKALPFLKYNLVKNLQNIYLTPESEKIGVTWINGQVWDKPLIKKFYSLLPKNKPFVVMDIGAQTGSFSLLSKYFPLSTWYAFEPIEEAAATLKKNVEINNIKNVLIYQTAVSDFSGTATLKLPPIDAWGLATLGSKPLRFDTFTERRVKCTSLDTFIKINQIKKIDFIKIDTEGSELAILHGAQKMIQRDHPIILMEYNETNMKQCNILKKDINDFLKRMGYSWKLVSSEDILCTHSNIK